MSIDITNHEQMQHMLHNYLAEKNLNLNDFDKQDIDNLLHDTLGGVESAQYLTGHKKKEVETFYDKHPIQATIHDTLNKAPTLAASAVGLQAGSSILKDYLLNRKINNAIKGSDKKEGLKPLSGEDYEKSPDLQRSFPKAVSRWENEKGEPKSKFNPDHDPGVYGDTYQKLNVGKPTLQKATPSDRFSTLLGASERKEQQMVRLLSQHFPKDTLKGKMNLEGVTHLRNMSQELGALNSHRAGRVAGRTAQRISDPNMHFKNMLSHINPRLAMGAGVAGIGGMALAPVVSYLQNRIYGEPKVHEWMKNKRQTEGKFN